MGTRTELLKLAAEFDSVGVRVASKYNNKDIDTAMSALQKAGDMFDQAIENLGDSNPRQVAKARDLAGKVREAATELRALSSYVTQ